MEGRNNGPPRLARVLLRCALDPEEFNEKSGDLEETFRYLSMNDGPWRARFWYWIQILKAAPMFMMENIYWRFMMWSNYLKTVWRNLKRNTTYSMMTIFGLAIGMCCALVLFMYVYEELTYDRYHENRDRVFRVYEVITTPTAVRKYAPIAWPLAPAVLDKYPQVEAAVRIYAFGTRLIKVNQEAFYEDRFIFAEPSLFNILTFEFLQGDPSRALERPNTLVLTKSIASKYFGDTSPLGSTITVNDQEYEITGIIEDTPRNTHLKTRIIASMKSIEDNQWMSNWHGTETYTYLKLRPDVDSQTFEQDMKRIDYDYVGELWTEWKSVHDFLLQPIDTIHLHSKLRYELETPGNLTMVLLVAGIGLLVLLVACMNYVNLATARSIVRAKEVGLRKVVGANRRELIRQFWGESFILASFTMAVSLGLLVMGLPFFNRLAGTTFDAMALLKSSSIFAVLGIIAFCGLGAGIYPSLLLSSYKPATILRGAVTKGRGGARVRKVMVIFQFVISILLAVSTLIIFQQIRYMKDQYPGFDKDQKLVIPVRGSASIRENHTQIKEEFLRHAAITGAAASSSVPGRGLSNFAIALYGEDDRKNQGMYHLYIDPDFIGEYGIEMAAGRNFEAKMSTDFSDWDKAGGFLLNEAAAKAFGIHDPLEALGRQLQTGLGGRTGPIIGVTRDFHYRGLQNAVEPLIMECFPNRFRCISLTLDTRSLKEGLTHVERIWHEKFPEVPLESFFLDADFNRQYRAEERLGRVAGTFTVMGLCVACLGLLGLASFTAAQRTKEIGIRKVLGASVPGILLLLSRHYLKSILVANAIAWPLTWWAMDLWLNRFATQMSIHIWPFLLAGAGTLLIALMTVSVQSFRAAIANPSDSLRYE